MAKSKKRSAWNKANPEKVRAYVRKWAKANRDKIREYERSRPIEKKRAKNRHRNLSRYDLTTDAYDTMLRGQGGVCAVCQKPETEIDRRTGAVISLSVDHDHATGAVRGLLCRRCNVGIGAFADNPVVLRSAASYLERSSRG